MVMPLTSFQIVMSKVWANGLIILIAFTLSTMLVVETILEVPIAGTPWLLLDGTTVYLLAAAAIGIFLGTVFFIASLALFRRSIIASRY